MDYQKLNSEQIKVIINASQIFEALESLRLESSSVNGSMHWKKINQKEYLYRAYSYGKNKSLGARNAETEVIKQHFEMHKVKYRDRENSLIEQVKLHSAYVKANKINRFPLAGARVIRALQQHNIPHRIVGTNALYAYEMKAGVIFLPEYVATGDVDILVNAQQGMKIASNLREETLLSLLQKTDKTFEKLSQGAFEFAAVNDKGYRVDFITQGDSNLMSKSAFEKWLTRDDLLPISIDSLKWCIASPYCDSIVFDDKGYPLRMVTLDPRAFVLHKWFTSQQPDRDPKKSRRDQLQAKIMAVVLSNELKNIALSPVIARIFPDVVQRMTVEEIDQFSI